MARKTGIAGAVQDLVAGLRQQRDELLQRLNLIEKQEQELREGKGILPLEELVNGRVQREAIRDLLPALETQISEAEQERRRQLEEERGQRAHEARLEALAILPEVVKATQDLKAAFDRLCAPLQREGTDLWYGSFPGGLYHAVHQTLEWWRMNRPELLGLPPRPTRQQELIEEARLNLASVRAGLERARALKGEAGRRGGDTRDINQVIQGHEQAIKVWETALAKAEGRWKEPEPKRIEKGSPAWHEWQSGNIEGPVIVVEAGELAAEEQRA